MADSFRTHRSQRRETVLKRRSRVFVGVCTMIADIALNEAVDHKGRALTITEELVAIKLAEIATVVQHVKSQATQKCGELRASLSVLATEATKQGRINKLQQKNEKITVEREIIAKQTAILRYINSACFNYSLSFF